MAFSRSKLQTSLLARPPLSSFFLGITSRASLYNAHTGPDCPVRGRGYLVYETRDPVLLVTTTTRDPRLWNTGSQEQRVDRTVERSKKRKSERTKRKGENSTPNSFVSNPSFYLCYLNFYWLKSNNMIFMIKHGFSFFAPSSSFQNNLVSSIASSRSVNRCFGSSQRHLWYQAVLLLSLLQSLFISVLQLFPVQLVIPSRASTEPTAQSIYKLVVTVTSPLMRSS